MNNKWARILFLSVILPSIALMASCATIVGDETQLVQVRSTPTGASISVKDESGAEVFSGKTPSSVTLAKSTGKYWGGKDYDVTISLAGYQAQTVHLRHHANGWYIAGNIVFGGIIGWFIVDPFNGKMYTLSPEAVNANLTSNTTSKNTYDPNTIKVSLISEVPNELLGKMIEVR